MSKWIFLSNPKVKRFTDAAMKIKEKICKRIRAFKKQSKWGGIDERRRVPIRRSVVVSIDFEARKERHKLSHVYLYNMYRRARLMVCRQRYTRTSRWRGKTRFACHRAGLKWLLCFHLSNDYDGFASERSVQKFICCLVSLCHANMECTASTQQSIPRIQLLFI